MKPATIFFLKAFVSACVIFISPASVFANTADYGIEVKGQASVLVEPDSFALSISITEQGRFTDKIRSIVDHKSNQVIKVARGLKIKAQDINSARISLRVIKDDTAIELLGLEVNQKLPRNQKSKVYVGDTSAKQKNRKPDSAISQYFELSRNITVNFSNIKNYDQFLTKIIKIGVSHISPLAMSISDTDKYYQQALAQAINNAKTKAQQIAVQAEQSLLKLIYVKELSSNHYRSRYNSEIMSANAAYGHSSQVGLQSINASVLVKYSIE